MNLTVSGHHVDVTPALDAHVLNKLSPILRHFDGDVSIYVTLTTERRKKLAHDDRQMACIKIVMNGNNINAEDKNDDLYAAINGMMTKIDRQVRDYMKQIKNHRPGVCHKRTAGDLRPRA